MEASFSAASRTPERYWASSAVSASVNSAMTFPSFSLELSASGIRQRTVSGQSNPRAMRPPRYAHGYRRPGLSGLFREGGQARASGQKNDGPVPHMLDVGTTRPTSGKRYGRRTQRVQGPGEQPVQTRAPARRSWTALGPGGAIRLLTASR